MQRIARCIRLLSQRVGLESHSGRSSLHSLDRDHDLIALVGLVRLCRRRQDLGALRVRRCGSRWRSLLHAAVIAQLGAALAHILALLQQMRLVRLLGDRQRTV